MKLLRIICCIGALLTAGPITSQRCHYTRQDSLTVCRILESGEKDVLNIARQFLNVPYVAHTLELYPDDERLVLNTSELDCTTFVDVVVALAICNRRGEKRFSDFVLQLHQQRYWGGYCNGYPSRIHYFSDWIDDNTRLGYVQELQSPNPPFTDVQTLHVDFMTKHRKSYVSLERHPEYLETIAEQEKSLTGRQYRYIPTSRIRNTHTMREAVHDGDILAITSTTPGLDIAHLGFAVWREDGLYMLDASSIHKKVLEEPVTLRYYLEHRKRVTGIRVVRIQSTLTK